MGAPGSPWALLSAALAGLTMLWLLPPPPRRVAQGAADDPRSAGRRVARLVAGRPDTLPAGPRLLLGAALGAAVSLVLARSGAGSWAWPLGLVLGLGSGLLVGWLEPAAARRRRRELVLHTPQALELLASCLAAGMPVRRACAAVVAAFDGAVAEDLGRVVALADLGVADAECWRSLVRHPQLGPAAADLARSVESGTLLVDGLRHHAARAREQRQADLQVAARSVGVRSVLPLMGCFIPSFLLLGVVPSVVSALSGALHL